MNKNKKKDEGGSSVNSFVAEEDFGFFLIVFEGKNTSPGDAWILVVLWMFPPRKIILTHSMNVRMVTFVMGDGYSCKVEDLKLSK